MSSKKNGRGARPTFTDQEALLFHSQGRPGKLEVVATKPMATQRDLSLAYSPGVAVPVLAIAEDEGRAYDYTTKGNFVAVITNGTAILGLGNRGALAAKPVMEGKAVLFKRFADIDSIDLEVSTEDPDEFINCVKLLGKSWGGINLEDIKAPECFIIEQRLRELLDIPVFHDDQHGTAIIAAAGLINALDLTGRDIKTTKLVCNGAGAAGIACLELLKAIGFTPENLILCDTKGVIYQGRTDGMNQWKSAHAVEDLGAHAGRGAGRRRRVLRPLGQGRGDQGDGQVDGGQADHLRHGQSRPGDHRRGSRRGARRRHHGDRALRLSEPDQQRARLPLHLPRRARRARDHHQHGDEDRRGRARWPSSRARTCPTRSPPPMARGRNIGPDYIIPVPFDPRLISLRAAGGRQGRHGYRRRAQADRRHGRLPRSSLRSRRDPVAGVLQRVFERLRRQPKRVVFAEGEEEQVIRAAASFVQQGLGTALLVGREDRVRADRAQQLGIELGGGIEIINAALSQRNAAYAAYLYERLQRKGYLLRDCQRLVNQDRNHFAACMVALGDADAMVTGVTRNFSVALEDVRRVHRPQARPPGDGRIAGAGARPHRAGRRHRGHRDAERARSSPTSRSRPPASRAGSATSRGVALLAFSTFGHPPGRARGARAGGGATSSTSAASISNMTARWRPTSRSIRNCGGLSVLPAAGPANVLIMPAFHSASISTKLLQELGGATVIGPLLVGLDRPVQIGSRPSGIRPASAPRTCRRRCRLLDQRRVDFEYDGDMAADVALNMEMREAYPFCRLSGPANVLIMPAFHSASISTKLLQELGGATVIGPMLVGLDRPVQIVPLSANDTQLVNMAALAAFNVSG